MKKKKVTMGIIIVFILFIGGFWAFNHLFYGVPGVIFSCENNDFIKFGYTSMPPAQMACLYNCEASIKIFNEKSELVCSNKLEECSSTNTVLVPCKELGDYEGEKLKMEYIINNGETKTEEIQYNK